MQTITGINHIGLRVRNFAVARDFYAQLGFKAVSGPIGPEPVAIVVHPCGININFILNANQEGRENVLMDVPTKHSGYTHVALEIDDKETLLAHLAALNIPLSGGPMAHATGTSFFIRDPDNNVIEFIEYRGLEALQANA
ncbi:MAG: VOC family protein [Xanthomonadales bacterium]|nr:VOC family protein [Xanthomonadales bacterium]